MGVPRPARQFRCEGARGHSRAAIAPSFIVIPRRPLGRRGICFSRAVAGNS